MDKDEAHRILLRAVVEHVGLYKGGPSYFTALDEWIRNKGYLLDFLDALLISKPEDLNVIVSGRFGRALANKMDEQGKHFKRLIILRGGLRLKGNKVDDISYLHRMDAIPFHFIDDSYHCGKTAMKVKDALCQIGARLASIMVVYDGSHPNSRRVHSLFRYYDWEGRQ